MTPVSLVDVASYLPPNKVGVDFFYTEQADPDTMRWDNPMFRPPRYRRHRSLDESAADMIEQAATALFDRRGHDARRDIDVVITNVLLPDLPHTGSGAEVAHRLGARPRYVLDLHNGGCASFVYMLKLAQTIIRAEGVRTALLCAVQNGAGPIYGEQTEVRKRSHAAIPGDGCGVGYVVASDESPVLAIECVNYGEHAADMSLKLDDRKYWQPGTSQFDVKFTESRVAEIISRGSRLVPEVVDNVCARVGISTHEIDWLITNQPNRMFLRNWQEALELKPDRHLDTFDQYGNLFGAAVPVTLDHAIRDAQVPDDALLVLAGFAHAGDFAAAAAVRWRAAP